MTQTEALELMHKIDKKSSDFEDNIEKSCKRITDAMRDSKVVRDEYGNSLLSIGTDDMSAKFDTWGSWSNDTLNWPLWTALYGTSWVVRRAIDKPAQDMVKAGVSFVNVDEQEVKKVQRLATKYRADFIQLLQWGSLYGGSIACMLFNNLKDDDYAKPIDYDKIKKSKTMRMYVVDRWYGVAPDYEKIVTNMSDVDYGKPMFYDVTLADGKTIKFHHDYVLRYEGRTAPKFIKNGLLQGWGYSELAHIFNEIVRDEKLKTSCQSLIDKSLIEVIKMSGMRGIFMGADSQNEEQLRKRLEMVNWGRNFNSLTFLDTDDDYQMNNFSGLSGLAELLQQNMWMISSALEMQGVLFGDLRSGFSSDDEAMKKYADVIQGRSETYLRPVYEKIFKLWYKICGIDKPVDFTFKTLIAEDEDDKHIEKIKNYVELLRTLMDSGVIDTKKFATLLQKYTSTGDASITFDQKELDDLDESFAEEAEDIDEESV